MSIKIYDKSKFFGKTKVVVEAANATPIPTYNLYFGDGVTTITNTNEGSYAGIALETTNVTEPIPYTITGVSEEDIGIPLAGFFNPGYGDVSFNIAQDFLTEGPETMVVTLDGISPTVSAALVINDTSAE